MHSNHAHTWSLGSRNFTICPHLIPTNQGPLVDASAFLRRIILETSQSDIMSLTMHSRFWGSRNLADCFHLALLTLLPSSSWLSVHIMFLGPQILGIALSTNAFIRFDFGLGTVFLEQQEHDTLLSSTLSACDLALANSAFFSHLLPGAAGRTSISLSCSPSTHDLAPVNLAFIYHLFLG